MTPEQLAKKLKTVKNKKIGLILGRESLGLNNEEIQMCDFIVSIPADKKYPVFNIHTFS
jgi:tRNA C32,U32 (ribose-2'-O)-methylase TrmJ